ncbi:hypothetical protein [Bythopirellula polymerisocia]|uniref:hypothetical protein n=1 Tax=Bythopirellula polymerisocia TaxID=2528003 RepID=UPI0011B81D4F|nr:hypothetical protein [Bythopirellula polymerisocia]
MYRKNIAEDETNKAYITKRHYQFPESRIELKGLIFVRARQLVTRGFGAADAVHLAAAESLQVDVLLTCDDRWLRKSRQLADEIKIRVANPVEWLKEQYDAKNIG